MRLGFVFVLFVFIFFASVFLFVGGPSAHALTVYREFWQLGHFFLFALIVFLLMQMRFVKSRHWVVQILTVGVFCLSVGLITEVLQRYFGRNFSLNDVLNDIIGGYVGFFVTKILSLHQTASSRSRKTRIFKQLAYFAIVVALALFSGRSFVKAAINEINARSDFPILSNFETLFEKTRWRGYRVKSTIDFEFARRGEKGMKIKFLPAQYPYAGLVNFIGDWQGYQDLKLSVFNAKSKKIEIILSIYDRQHHHTGYRYEDRFNKMVALEPGWNDLSYSLDDIQNAPEDRQMDMTKIYSFSLYMIKLKQPTVIYVDEIYLAR